MRFPWSRENIDFDSAEYCEARLIKRQANQGIGTLAICEHIVRHRKAVIAANIQKAAGLGNIPRIERGKQP